jgi:predicted nuclease of predicted toxin-antitoxin system
LGYVKKRREECVLFLDEGFSAESVASRLRTAGFTVQRFHEWFKDTHGVPLKNIPDPDIIKFCHRNGWMLVTKDHEMKHLHRQEIRKSDVAILATANNSAANEDEWLVALINLKARILREFKNHERPWFATFSRSAVMRIETIK